MNVLLSHLKVQGAVKNAQVGEPKSPPLDVLTAAILMDGIRTPELVMDARVLVYDVIIRVYRSFLDEGTKTETEVARVVGEIMEALAHDFSLGDNSRAVDFGGHYGNGVEVRWGHLDIGGSMFRMADITVPLIIDPAAEFER